MTVVAVRRKGCKVCEAGKEVWEAVNESIWDGNVPMPSTRVWGNRTRSAAVMAAHGQKCDVRTIDRHRAHVEASARTADEHRPQTSRELKLYDTAFESVTDRMAGLGMAAAEMLDKRLKTGDMDDKALVATATLGLRAAHNRETIAAKERNPIDSIKVIFAVGGGYLRAPEQQVIEGAFSEVDLKAEIEAKRAALRELAAG